MIDLYGFLILKNDRFFKKGCYKILNFTNGCCTVDINGTAENVMFMPVFLVKERSYKYHKETKYYKVLENKAIHGITVVAKVDMRGILGSVENYIQHTKATCITKTKEKINHEYIKSIANVDYDVYVLKESFDTVVHGTNYEFTYVLDFIIDIVDYSQFTDRHEYNEYNGI